VPELARALDFLLLADKAGTRVVPFRYGKAVFDERLPRRWDSNYLLVEQLPEEVGAGELADAAERIQGAAGLAHRKLEVRDEQAGARLDPEFRRLGWTVHRHVLMAQRRRAGRSPDLSAVREVEERDLRAARAQQIASLPWGDDPNVVTQLLDAKTFMAQAVETRFFAVEHDGRPVSWTDLYLADGVAQVEDVGTLAAYRGRGFASAVVLKAVAEARRAGTELVFLIADDEDWPKELYHRLGFDELGRVYEFLLARPEQS
jgi:GNAT superfamily N-acetyltransferase